MQARRRQRTLLAFAYFVLILLPQPTRSQEVEGRPHVETEEARRIKEEREGLKREERKPVTEIERAERDIDITKPENKEFVDADKLSDLLNDSDTKRRDAQAIHSWEGHESEFRKAGVEDVEQLKRHIDEVRNNPDIHISLKRGRELYAKLDNGKEGTIVIDTPGSDNGGTAFRNSDVRQRVVELSNAP